jgi:phosphotransferase system IIB component
MSMRSAICLINVQVITGPDADTVADEIRTVIAQGGRDAVKPVATAAAASGAQCGPLDPDPLRWLAVFGGAGNVASLDAVAATRLRIVVRDPSAVDRQRLATLYTAWVSANTFRNWRCSSALRRTTGDAFVIGCRCRCRCRCGAAARAISLRLRVALTSVFRSVREPRYSKGLRHSGGFFMHSRCITVRRGGMAMRVMRIDGPYWKRFGKLINDI